MKITYIFHSGFAVETDNSIFVFDYYRKELPGEIAETKKNVIFFSSHTHSDHFNPEIFSYARDNVYYVISKDIEDKIVHRNMLDNYKNVNLIYVKPHETLSLFSDSVLIETLKSTDRGVAFIVTTEGKTVYHAGDLSIWNFEDTPKEKANDMTARYKREMELIKGRTFHAAFLPVDYRLGKFYADGAISFLKNTNTLNVFPMHMWKKYEYIDTFKNDTAMKDYTGTIHVTDTTGNEFVLD